MAQETTATDGADTEQSRKLGDFLRSYAPPSANPTRDMLDGHYRIDLAAALPQFDTKHALAYNVVDSQVPDRPLMALVCSPGIMQRHKAIATLKSINHPNILSLVASGVVQLSRPDEERFIVIYEQPAGKKLSELMLAYKTRPSIEFLSYSIIDPIAQAIQQMVELGVTHGTINPDNIYYDKVAVLGPCVTEPCGFAQRFYYEPIERMQAMPAGKGEGSPAHDFYAMGVLVLELIFGSNHFKDVDHDKFMTSVIKEGAFNALTFQKDIPELFYDFLRGLFTQNAHERWSFKYVKAWLEGKRYNVLPPAAPSESVRPFEFAGASAYTRREIAHLFFTHWDEVIETLGENSTLAQWVYIALRNKELLTDVNRISRALSGSGKKNEALVDEEIMRLIIMLDPMGPARYKKLAFHIDGIDGLAADLFTSQSLASLQNLSRFIELSAANFVLERQAREFETRDDLISHTTETMMTRLDRLRPILRQTGNGFGIERILYETNPSMQCLSPLLSKYYVTTLPQLLRALDALAASQAKVQDPMDRHIAAFIMSRLHMNHEVRLAELESQPKLAQNKSILTLRLLAAAQEKAHIHSLPGLTHWLVMRVIPSVDVMRSKTLRKKLKTLLADHARGGNLPHIASLIIESGFAQAEAEAFEQAVTSYRNNAINIIHYRQGEMLDEHSRQLGFNLAHYASFLALVIVTAVIVWGG